MYLSFIILGKLWIHIELNHAKDIWFSKGRGYLDNKPYESHICLSVPKVGFIQIMYLHHNNHPSKYFCFIKKFRGKKR